MQGVNQRERERERDTDRHTLITQLLGEALAGYLEMKERAQVLAIPFGHFFILQFGKVISFDPRELVACDTSQQYCCLKSSLV